MEPDSKRFLRDSWIAIYFVPITYVAYLEPCRASPLELAYEVERSTRDNWFKPTNSQNLHTPNPNDEIAE
jgi:hypothetical protein